MKKKTGREKFKKYKGFIIFLINIFNIFPKKIINILLLWNRNSCGIWGLVIRYVLVKNLAKSCGNNVSIQPGVYLYNIQNMKIGNNVSIHPMCYIDGAGGVEIGDDVSIAHNSSILSASHTWDDLDIPIKYNKETLTKVIINNDVWIGCGVRILAGVKIESRSIIAAGAVVNRSFESKTLIGGVPAKTIKKINEN
jgi:acetyltransferase-like isoleucine patch superfamily enzyme